MVASGIGLAWPGDLQLLTTPRSGAAADATTEPSATLTAANPAMTTAPTAASGAPTDPTTAPGSVAEFPAATLFAGPSTTGLAPGASTPIASSDPSSSPAPDATSTGELAIVPDLGVNAERRRAQTWDPPADPSRLDGYQWPLPKAQITNPFGPSPFGSHVVDGQLYHDGIDIATFCGDHVRAAHDGTVLAAGRHFDEMIGWVGSLAAYTARLDAKSLWWTLPITIVIDDGNGYRSIYAHFSQVLVKPGQHVTAGQVIGDEGATGRATGCHLHYGLFSPHETATIAMEPKAVKDLLVPPTQIARIDPLLVLPHRAGDEAPVPANAPGTGHDLGD